MFLSSVLECQQSAQKFVDKNIKKDVFWVGIFFSGYSFCVFPRKRFSVITGNRSRCGFRTISVCAQRQIFLNFSWARSWKCPSVRPDKTYHDFCFVGSFWWWIYVSGVILAQKLIFGHFWGLYKAENGWNRWFWWHSSPKFGGRGFVQIWPCKVFWGL